MIKPKIVLSLSDTDTCIGHSKSIPNGVDIIEARIDRFKHLTPDYVLSVLGKLKRFNRPIIGTIRKKQEGGSFNFSEERRFELFKNIINLIDIMDIELSSSNYPSWRRLIEQAHKMKKKVIISYHNLKMTPKDFLLEQAILRAKRRGADIIKIACLARQLYDVRILLELTLKYSKTVPLISLSLGRIGSISRIVFPLAGSIFTYAYLDKTFAPGQIPLEVLRNEVNRYYLT